MRLGVIDEVQVDEFFQFNVSGLYAIQHVGEQHGHVLADCHTGNDFFDRVDFDFGILRMQFHAQLVHFSLFLGAKELSVIINIDCG